MTEKRFIILDSSISGRYIKDKEHRFDEPMNLRVVCNLLNELNNENKQLHRINEENKKMIQSIGEELAKLRIIEKNLRKIKYLWNWIMESVDYD